VIGDAYLRYAEDTTPDIPKKPPAQNMPSVPPKVPPRHYIINELFPEEHLDYLILIHKSHDIDQPPLPPRPKGWLST